MNFKLANAIFAGLSPIFRPPTRLKPSEAANKHFRLPEGAMFDVAVTPYMKEPMDLAASRDYSSIVVVAPARTGKALCLNTPIATPDGYRQMGGLKTGDVVFGDDGKPTVIEQAHPVQHDKDCYRVHFSNGDSIVADGEHLWTVNERVSAGAKRNRLTLETVDMLENFKDTYGRYRYEIPVTKPLDMPDQDLPIDPYILGYWLGDGDSDAARITCDSDDVSHVMSAVTRAGYIAKRVDRSATVSRVIIDGQYTEYAGRFKQQLADLDLINNKHIPDQYMRASTKQRSALLAGLMDSDGTITAKGHCKFYNRSTPIVSRFRDLLSTLGVKCTVKPRSTIWNTPEGAQTRLSWIVTFTMYRDLPCAQLPRKRDRLKECKGSARTRTQVHTIVNIEPVPSVPVRCITVANDSKLYLAGMTMIPTHNTLSLLDGILSWLMSCNPSDTLVVHMTETSARKYSRMRIARMIRNSPLMSKLLTKNRDDDNILFKTFRNGMALVIGSPAPTNLSAADYKYVLVSDYDRMPDDNGEGNIFTQAQKRTQTFGSAGMAVVESSPARDFYDNEWRPDSRHAAPPVGGILGLYNDGDRRMWYWTCPHCTEQFPTVANFDLFCLPDHATLLLEIEQNGSRNTAKKYSQIYCPHCGGQIEEREKAALNSKGEWIKDDPESSNTTASFWLGGVAAKFQGWTSLLDKYFKALIDFDKTADEKKLKAVLNVDVAMPFIPFGVSNKISAHELEERAVDIEKHIVPVDGVALFASIDVQAYKFAVYVECIMSDGSKILLDRYDIVTSNRRDSSGEITIINPPTYIEDWDVIEEQVITSRYIIEGGTHDMGITMTVCDSGGKEGTTEKAYLYSKKMVQKGLGSKFQVIKGERPKPESNKPIVSKSIMDKSSSAARSAGTIGTQVVWILNTTVLKDSVYNNLKRKTKGLGYMDFPQWLPSWVYKELTVEVRGDKGWDNILRQANETFDLAGYARAAFLIKRQMTKTKEIDWSSPPHWLSGHETNPEVAIIGQYKLPKRQSRARKRKVRMKRS